MSVHEILAVTARRVWDSRGQPTVEAEVRLRGGARGRGIAPAGASTGRAEAVDLRDRGKALQGRDVQSAIAGVRGEIARALKGMDVRDQRALDRRLCELDGTADKRRLGANATVAVSIAAAHAAAAAAGMPLWRWLADGAAAVLPLPEIQIFGGGAHAARRIDIQDLMVVAIGARTFDQALEWTAEIYAAAGQLLADAGKRRGVADEGGYWPEFDRNDEALEYLVRAIEQAGFRPGEDVAIALDIAASELGRGGRYRLALEREELASAELAARIEDWTRRFPIVSVEDPLGEDDEAGLAELTARLGARVQVVGDDYLVSSAARVRHAAAAGACNAVLLKPNQAGTLSEIRDTLDAAREAGFGAIVSARSGETEDVTIVHLAVGWGVPQLKVGSFARSERMAKWNEALRIEESLGEKAAFAGAGALSGSSAHRREPEVT